MTSKTIEFQNRYTGQRETETVYGESYLRWIYEQPTGRAALSLLVKRKVFSTWYGTRMDRPKSAGLIGPFVERYGIDMAQYARAAEDFASFNEFFYRKLKPEARPLDAEPATVCFPADGRHLGVQNIEAASGFYVKDQHFDLRKFLGEASLTSDFEGGSLVISRLCPIDYHRFHSPVSGTIHYADATPGSLFSVSPIALKRKLGYLWENKRLVAIIENERLGRVAFVPVGATCVGRIHMTRPSGSQVEKGEELGYFAFGGSCVVTVFQKDRVKLEADLVDSTSEATELYAHVRDGMGRVMEGGVSNPPT